MTSAARKSRSEASNRVARGQLERVAAGHHDGVDGEVAQMLFQRRAVERRPPSVEHDDLARRHVLDAARE